MCPHRPRIWQMLSVAPLLMLAACSGASAQGPTTPTTTAATPTLSAQAQCQALPGFSGASAASTAPGFSDAPLPASTFLTTPTHSFGGTGLFAISEVDACTTSSSVGTIQTFFAQSLPTNGWAQSQTYPYDGGRQVPCGDQYCWSKDNAPRYVSLEKVTDAGQSHVTYHLRLASPPAPPTGQYCAASGFAITWHGAPLPPLSTLFGGSSTSYAGDVSVCSAGTSASIDAFFKTELPNTNWKQQNPPSSNRCYTSGLSAWWNGTVYFTYDLRAWTASQPYYTITYCAP
jgi:hypothetical protein